MKSEMVKRRLQGSDSDQWGSSETKARNWYVIHHLASDLYSPFLKDTQAEEISNKLSNLKTAERTRARKIQDMESNIRKLQAELEPRDVENNDDIEEEIVRSFTLLLKALHSNEPGTALSQPK